jgi:hypothetical protein
MVDSFSHRGRNSVKLLGSLRGDGLLTHGQASIAVSYQLDIYEGRNRRTGGGALEGPLGPLADAEVKDAVLRLADGALIEVVLSEIDAQGAYFETRGDLPAPS